MLARDNTINDRTRWFLGSRTRAVRVSRSCESSDTRPGFGAYRCTLRDSWVRVSPVRFFELRRQRCLENSCRSFERAERIIAAGGARLFHLGAVSPRRVTSHRETLADIPRNAHVLTRSCVDTAADGCGTRRCCIYQRLRVFSFFFSSFFFSLFASASREHTLVDFCHWPPLFVALTWRSS